eukprot:CAMPEP_0119526746 /NCGR_PEP_ID=MMETSP1344-20130328/41296_1 /TAXON_ID=236787 /ORGANISM="Florenciella parvula, Strain CCMP2471" /LENGTH=111 /DNA_ID=CAMNT_0007565807 /DNA_START=353 /DNA_END=689 /DNA_ORIENTATION=+
MDDEGTGTGPCGATGCCSGGCAIVVTHIHPQWPAVAVAAAAAAAAALAVHGCGRDSPPCCQYMSGSGGCWQDESDPEPEPEPEPDPAAAPALTAALALALALALASALPVS